MVDVARRPRLLPSANVNAAREGSSSCWLTCTFPWFLGYTAWPQKAGGELSRRPAPREARPRFWPRRRVQDAWQASIAGWLWLATGHARTHARTRPPASRSEGHLDALAPAGPGLACLAFGLGLPLPVALAACPPSTKSHARTSDAQHTHPLHTRTPPTPGSSRQAQAGRPGDSKSYPFLAASNLHQLYTYPGHLLLPQLRNHSPPAWPTLDALAFLRLPGAVAAIHHHHHPLANVRLPPTATAAAAAAAESASSPLIVHSGTAAGAHPHSFDTDALGHVQPVEVPLEPLTHTNQGTRLPVRRPGGNPAHPRGPPSRPAHSSTRFDWAAWPYPACATRS
ncbi:uncharacterized protein PSFLO_00925 [Pseudozyma flocculosa]|uniref:Uncharacterized protein n=1 Tax=Pseudozyma flocculosa TaxID=84751 RepID=A0A5C3ESY6_9BASI|nr:uncharacterized protein PSFLO_00925 [Pseudozyma flocculosa]